MAHLSAVRVVGYIGDAAPVAAEARRAIAEADIVVGGRRHLEAFDVPESRRVVLGPLDPAIEALQARGDARAVVVASGDPGFFGIVRRLRAAGLELLVEPAPSACALTFGRLGIPWEDAQIVSAHGRDLRRALNVIRAHDTVAVMTTVGAGLRDIAAGLHAGQWPRRLALVESIGEPDERVRWFSIDDALSVSDIVEPNIVVAVATSPGPWTGPGMPWRLGDRGRHERAAEVCADPLAILVAGSFDLAPGDLLALAGPDLDVVASAADQRGAAVVRLDQVDASSERPTDLGADVLCVAVRNGEVPAVDLDAVIGSAPLRGFAIITDEMSLARAESVVALMAPEFDCRHVCLPASAHLLIATRRGDERG